MAAKTELLPIETRIVTLLAPIGANMVGVFSESIPKGQATILSSLPFIIMRPTNPIVDRRLLGGTPQATVVDYEVVATWPEASIAAPLFSRADDIYNYLHDTRGTVDAIDIAIERLRPYKRQYVKDGIVWSELGHVFRIFMRTTASIAEPALNTYLAHGTAGIPGEVNLTPYCERIKLLRGASNFVDFWGYHDTANIINNFHATFWNVAGKSLIYGPHGNATGNPKLTATATLLEFDIDSDATLNTFNPITFRGRLKLDSAITFGTF